MRHIITIPRFILTTFVALAIVIGLMAVAGLSYARSLSGPVSRNEPLTPRQEVNLDQSPSYDGWDAVNKLTSKGELITSLDATLIVPQVPHTDHDQTVFVFSGLSGSRSNTLLQPVLQYGRSVAGGTRGAWSMGAWSVTDARADRSNLIPVRPGDRIATSMRRTTCGNGQCSWVISMINARSGEQVSHTTRLAINDAVDRPQSLVVETYGMTSCSDLPQAFRVSKPVLNGAHRTSTLDVRNAASGACGLRSSNTASEVNLIH